MLFLLWCSHQLLSLNCIRSKVHSSVLFTCHEAENRGLPSPNEAWLVIYWINTRQLHMGFMYYKFISESSNLTKKLRISLHILRTSVSPPFSREKGLNHASNWNLFLNVVQLSWLRHQSIFQDWLRIFLPMLFIMPDMSMDFSLTYIQNIRFALQGKV